MDERSEFEKSFLEVREKQRKIQVKRNLADASKEEFEAVHQERARISLAGTYLGEDFEKPGIAQLLEKEKQKVEELKRQFQEQMADMRSEKSFLGSENSILPEIKRTIIVPGEPVAVDSTNSKAQRPKGKQDRA